MTRVDTTDDLNYTTEIQKTEPAVYKRMIDFAKNVDDMGATINTPE
jgi:hypothetical protein